MADVLKRVPVREQDPKVRATNFEEVCLGYNKEEAMEEAARCLELQETHSASRAARYLLTFQHLFHEVKEGKFERRSSRSSAESSALPAVCGRVCPQESQCEGKCIRGIKGDPVSIGKLERFVADWARENGIKPARPADEERHQGRCDRFRSFRTYLCRRSCKTGLRCNHF